MKKAQPRKGNGNWLELPAGINYQKFTIEDNLKKTKKPKKRLKDWVWGALIIGLFLFLCFDWFYFLNF